MDTLWGVVGDDKIKAFLSIILRIRDYEFSSVLELIPKYVLHLSGYHLRIRSVFYAFAVRLALCGVKKTGRHSSCDSITQLLFGLFVKGNFVCDSKFS